MRFLDVKTDFAFKKVFGSEGSKDILLSFINAVIDFEGHRVESLEILDPYQIPLIAGMKDSYVDVKARLDSGTQVIIEMQVLNMEGFEQRILYNAAKSYSTQIVSGEEYANLMPVVALTITDFIMFSDLPEVRSEYRMKEVKHTREYNGDIRLIFYELPKFKKTIDELETLEDKWLFFVQGAGSLNVKPVALSAVPEIDHALEIANEAGLTCAELEAQHKRRDFIMLQRGSIKKALKDGYADGHQEGHEKGLKIGLKEGLETGLKKGHEEGLRKGLETGFKDGQVLIAKRLKAVGMSNDEIMKATGLSENELLKIE
ncbi:MAG: Rpn family recombination-promoting nuclease/putative transposase [Methanomicrobiales archaeon]|nr:Rpn family recombination-promoting nuclease/putative transposase [Methanomicrobiales archaeon]